MARSGRSSQKSGARRVTLGILIFGALALIVAQSAPQISNFFLPARTTVSDRIGAPADTSLWAQLTGQADREQRIRELENEVRDQTTRLLVTPTLELSMPAKLVSRMQIVGNRELNRWTSLTRNAIIEGKVAHDGLTLFAQHVQRVVAVKDQGACKLSSIRSRAPSTLASAIRW